MTAVEEFANKYLSGSIEEFRPLPYMNALLEAIERHPVSEGHRWTILHGRLRSIWYCEKCGVPVGKGAQPV